MTFKDIPIPITGDIVPILRSGFYLWSRDERFLLINRIIGTLKVGEMCFVIGDIKSSKFGNEDTYCKILSPLNSRIGYVRIIAFSDYEP